MDFVYAYDSKRFSISIASINETIQEFAQLWLHARILYVYYYLWVGEYPADLSMYETLLAETYWPYMVNDVQKTVINCCECAHNRVIKTPTRHLRMFQPQAHLSLSLWRYLSRFWRAPEETITEWYWPIDFQATKSRAHSEDKPNECSMHVLRPLEHNIRNNTLTFHRKRHTVCE